MIRLIAGTEEHRVIHSPLSLPRGGECRNGLLAPAAIIASGIAAAAGRSLLARSPHAAKARGSEVSMHGNERVLLADPTEARSLRAADGVVAAGGEAIVVT